MHYTAYQDREGKYIYTDNSRQGFIQGVVGGEFTCPRLPDCPRACKSCKKHCPLYQKPDITKYPLIANCDISPRVLNALIFIRL